MEDPDGDNIWEFTALLAAGDSIEYKYSADSWNIQEELDTNLSSSCIITNYDPQAPNGFAYVNRWGVVNSETTLDIVCWNDCIECQGQTGIEESFYKEILVYPNPSTGSFYIKSGSIIKKIVIYNSLGETVFVKESLAAFEGYNLSIAKNGLYFISILNGDQIINRKILIQN
jgi:hypothetical protein